MENSKKIPWYTLAFMAFSTVWGFGNVLNGFVYFNGIQVIFSWILMFALYFVPYALMVGELGSAFKHSGGGVSSWIHETINPKFAYYAGWTYWACHVTYIASKGSGGLKALSWMFFHPVYPDDVRSPRHQSKRRLCFCGLYMGQADSPVQRGILYLPFYPGICRRRMRENFSLCK